MSKDGLALLFCSLASDEIFSYLSFKKFWYLAWLRLLVPITKFRNLTSDSPIDSQYFFQQSIES